MTQCADAFTVVLPEHRPCHFWSITQADIRHVCVCMSRQQRRRVLLVSLFFAAAKLTSFDEFVCLASWDL